MVEMEKEELIGKPVGMKESWDKSVMHTTEKTKSEGLTSEMKD